MLKRLLWVSLVLVAGGCEHQRVKPLVGNSDIEIDQQVDWGWGAIVTMEPDGSMSLYESTNNNTTTLPEVPSGKAIVEKYQKRCSICEHGVNKGNVIYTPFGSQLWVWGPGTQHAHEPNKMFSKDKGVQFHELNKQARNGKTLYEEGDFILISTGVNGLLGVNENVRDRFHWKQILFLEYGGAEIDVSSHKKGDKVLIIGRTKRIINRARELWGEQKKVVIYIHTTC